MKKIVVSLDLEMAQPSGKIIQIGAVVGNMESGEVISRFSSFVNPHETLSEFIVELTGITQQDVDNAGSLSDAYTLLSDWLFQYKKIRVLNAVTWGGDDAGELRRQLGLDLESGAWIFGRRWLDAKTLFSAWSMAKGKDARSGLKKSMGIMGLTFDGRAHDALADAENTFKVWKFLVDQFK